MFRSKVSRITKHSLPLHLLSCQKCISASSCNSPCSWHDPLPEEPNLSILQSVTVHWSPNLWLNLEMSTKAWQRLSFEKKIAPFSTKVYDWPLHHPPGCYCHNNGTLTLCTDDVQNCRHAENYCTLITKRGTYNKEPSSPGTHTSWVHCMSHLNSQ